jgi:uncharacterized membrane protein YfcA
VLVNTGWLTRFLSGLLGIDGGLVIVPALMFGLPLIGVSGGELAKVAIATEGSGKSPTGLDRPRGGRTLRNVGWGASTLG